MKPTTTVKSQRRGVEDARERRVLCSFAPRHLGGLAGPSVYNERMEPTPMSVHPAPPRSEPLRIGAVLRNAIAFNPHPRGRLPMNDESLLDQSAALFALLRLRQVDFVLVGGLAMLQYVPGRNTQDIDLIMALADLHRLPEVVVESSDINFARGRFGDLLIDVLLTRNRLFDTVRKQYTTTRPFAEGEIPCATVEGLLLLKLYALPLLYRQGDLVRVNLYQSDIGLMLHIEPHVDQVFALLTNHLPDSALLELRRIVYDLSPRMDRFGLET